MYVYMYIDNRWIMQGDRTSVTRVRHGSTTSALGAFAEAAGAQQTGDTGLFACFLRHMLRARAENSEHAIRSSEKGKRKCNARDVTIQWESTVLQSQATGHGCGADGKA